LQLREKSVKKERPEPREEMAGGGGVGFFSTGLHSFTWRFLSKKRESATSVTGGLN